MAFKKDEVVTLYYVDDNEMTVAGGLCKCTNPEAGQFWIDDLGSTGSLGTHVFFTEKEALKAAASQFQKQHERYQKMANDFKQASKNCENQLLKK